MEGNGNNVESTPDSFVLSKLETIMHVKDDHMNRWNALLALLGTTSFSTCGDHLVSTLREAVAIMFNDKSLIEIWNAIFQLAETKPSSAIAFGSKLMLGYQTISNFFGKDAPFDRHHHKEVVIKSFLVSFSGVSCTNRSQEAILDMFNSQDSQTEIISMLSSDKILRSSVLRQLSPQRTLRFTRTALMLQRRLAGSHRHDRNAQSEHEAVVDAFLKSAFEKCEIPIVVDDVILRTVGTVEGGTQIASIIPLEGLPVLTHAVASLWGERMFVSRGDERAQSFYTSMLVTGLDRMGMSVNNNGLLSLMARGGGGAEIVGVLSTGIAAYLDSTDKNTRLRGMRVATSFSRALGKEIQFPDLALDPSPSPSLPQGGEHKAVDGEVRGGRARDRQRLTPPGGEEGDSDNEKNCDADADGDDDVKGGDSSSDVSDGSSDVSELEALNIEDDEGGPKDGMECTPYLSTCLEMLQYPDSKPEAHDKHKAALVNIPRVVATSPHDACDLVEPLVTELMRLQNAFNMENFGELRDGAVQALLRNHPALGIHAVTRVLEDGGSGLGVRLEALGALVKAALGLAGLDSDPIIVDGEGQEIDGQGLIEGGNAAVGGLARVEGMEREGSGTTRIKHPRKLALSRRPIKYFKNRFGPVAHLFYFPVLGALIQSLRSQGPTLPTFSSSSSPLAIEHLVGLGRGGADSRKGGGGDATHGAQTLGSGLKEESDGIDALLPSRALLALGAFVKSSVNTPAERVLVEETLKAAFGCRNSASLAVRRAALAAMVECARSCLRRRHHIRGDGGGGERMVSFAMRRAGSALDVLRDVGVSHGGQGQRVAAEEALLAQCAEWAVGKLRGDEADTHCRVLGVEVVDLAVQCLQP